MAYWVGPKEYTAFGNEDQAVEFCKAWGLLPQKATKQKLYRYKGQGLDVPCEVIGFADLVFAVIRVGDQLHNIHPSYLREMQAANYGSNKLEEADEAQQNADDTVTVNDADEIGTLEEVAGEQEGLKAGKSTKEVKSAKQAKPAAEAPISFPEAKVTIEAIVCQFASVPNPFSDTDDEVVIFEQVLFVHEDRTITLEFAWSSHSQALKKLELQIGDKLSLEAKLVAKKLNKHPVKYKINNAAKIVKQYSQ